MLGCQPNSTMATPPDATIDTAKVRNRLGTRSAICPPAMVPRMLPTANSASEGLNVLRSGRQFNVILTDIEMPDMNGFEFAEAIRADHRTSATPIIALSSLISPAAIERGKQVGFHDYVAKFDRPGLIAALKEQTSQVSWAA